MRTVGEGALRLSRWIKIVRINGGGRWTDSASSDNSVTVLRVILLPSSRMVLRFCSTRTSCSILFVCLLMSSRRARDWINSSNAVQMALVGTLGSNPTTQSWSDRNERQTHPRHILPAINWLSARQPVILWTQAAASEWTRRSVSVFAVTMRWGGSATWKRRTWVAAALSPSSATVDDFRILLGAPESGRFFAFLSLLASEKRAALVPGVAAPPPRLGLPSPAKSWTWRWTNCLPHSPPAAHQ